MGGDAMKAGRPAFVGVAGPEFTLGGKPVRFCGVNYGNWMLIESYMLGLPWTEYKMRSLWRSLLGDASYHAFFDTFMDAYAADADFAYMKELGFNLIQLPFNYRWFGSDRTCAAFEGRGFEYVDRFVELCGRHGMHALISMHAAPGCAVRDWNAESAYGEAMLWDHRHFWNDAADIWTRVADRYTDDARVFGFEILNEPLIDDLQVFNDFNRAMLNAVRGADKNHVIVVNANRWGKDIDSLADDLFDDPLVVPSFHHYHSNFPPFGVLDKYPGDHDGKRYGREELLATLAGRYDTKRIRRPHLAGECGAPAWFGDESKQLLETAIRLEWDDVLAEFNRLGFSWNFWAFKDLGRLGLVSPRADTPWRRFLDRPEVRSIAVSYQEWMDECAGPLDRHARFMSGDDKKLFRFMTKHHWDAVALPKVLELLKPYGPDELREMARSFSFENCSAHDAKTAVVRKRAGEVRAWNAAR